jgi:hypothetical protein
MPSLRPHDRADDKLTQQLACLFPGRSIGACDLSAALGTDSGRGAVSNSIRPNFYHRNDSSPTQLLFALRYQRHPSPPPNPFRINTYGSARKC